MRNTATPQQPLGVSPAEDEWWKVYMNIEYPTANTGEGNWPMSWAGTPQGANVMNPLNAFIFGRKTAENKLLEKMGPWAEGNNFDHGVVDSSRAVLSNKQYWESAFRQRGAMAVNSKYSAGFTRSSWRGYSYFGRNVSADYLPSPYDPIFFSTSLFTAGRTYEKFFKEYASNTIYMRYPPSIKGGVHVEYGWPKPAPNGVLKRKNAAKDLLGWGLWAYAYYFKGSEQQRSIFCDRRPWKSQVIDFSATKAYTGQQRPFVEKRDVNGPLTVCDVGFDFYKYYTRQNVFAPAVALPHSLGVPGGVREAYSQYGAYQALDKLGNPKLEQYRVSYKYEIPGVNQTVEEAREFARYSWCYRDYKNYPNISEGVENYDWLQLRRTGKFYGKTLRVRKQDMNQYFNSILEDGGEKEAIQKYADRHLFECYYDNANLNSLGSKSFSFRTLAGSGADTEVFDYTTRKSINSFPAVLAGYYLQTTAVDNPSMKFKLRIWKGTAKAAVLYEAGDEIPDDKSIGDIKEQAKKPKIVHETIISKKYSYAINRNFDKKYNDGKGGARAYIFNKMHYFKQGISDKYGPLRFEIVPAERDVDPPYSNVVIPSEKKSAKDMYRGDGLISFGDPFSDTIKYYQPVGPNYKPYISWEAGIDSVPGDTQAVGAQYLRMPDYTGVRTGDLVRIKYRYKTIGEKVNWSTKHRYLRGVENITGYVRGGQILFARRVDDKLYFYERQDGYRMFAAAPDGSLPGHEGGNVKIYEALGRFRKEQFNENATLADNVINHTYLPTRDIIIEKMEPPPETFKVTLDLAVLVKTKPTFQDAYALLRAATDKQNRRNTDSNIIFGDAQGVGTVGHHFSEANRVFNNYYKYGSAMNIYGSSVVPALRMYVSANPIYESMRKFVSSFMRFSDRRDLINYTVENGRGVFYFRRFSIGLPKSAKAIIFRNMEGGVEPSGWFDGSDDRPDSLKKGHVKFNPIRPNVRYKVSCPRGGGIYYKKKPYGDGKTFWGEDQEHIDSYRNLNPERHGAFPIDGIRNETATHLVPGAVESGGVFQGETNEWIMFMTSSHYHWANSNIYKPDVYNDIMGFLNNRCHHRSKEYERSYGHQYDMIRTELCRVMPGPRNDPGPRLHIFMSKSSSNLTYVFNTNDPYQGNLGLYAEHEAPPYDYYRSCPPMTRRPYRIRSVKVVSMPMKDWNPTAYKVNGKGPSEVVRVELTRPLAGTGRLGVGRSGWRGVNAAKLQKEPYRTDENAVIEYIHHDASKYSCKRNMIGDHGALSDVVEGVGYRPFGACYPRFYFLKLIPKVPKGALLDTEPYAQMDFYFRAMSGAFVNPYSTPIKYGLYKQTSVLNWQYGELASRSSEEDPTLYEYIDPRDIQS